MRVDCLTNGSAYNSTTCWKAADGVWLVPMVWVIFQKLDWQMTFCLVCHGPITCWYPLSADFIFISCIFNTNYYCSSSCQNILLRVNLSVGFSLHSNQFRDFAQKHLGVLIFLVRLMIQTKLQTPATVAHSRLEDKEFSVWICCGSSVQTSSDRI